MELRRSVSVPIKLRDNRKECERNPSRKTIPVSYTVHKIVEIPKREDIISFWKSLQIDIKKVQKGFISHQEPLDNAIIINENPTKQTSTKCNGDARTEKNSNNEIKVETKVIIKSHPNNDYAGKSDNEKVTSVLPALEGTLKKGSDQSGSMKTLIQRLLSWKLEENCRELPNPKLRPEDLLCTCGASQSKLASYSAARNAERARSKSVGYETTKEVAKFRRCASAGASVGLETASALRARAALTLARRYYPEGGWGWAVAVAATLVHTIAVGLQLGGGPGPIACAAALNFHVLPYYTYGVVGALSAGVALGVSPLAVALGVRKSARVTAVLGGLVAALGCLFTSFATQFHQLFFSYGTVVGVGVGLTRDCSTLMVGQYFKRRREFVEIFVVSGSGLGIALMSSLIKTAIRAIGWRLGLQAVTLVVFLTFILGVFYRSASLYHPQRRAILHLKNQNKIKRKMKDKKNADDRQPFLDFSTLRSKTVRILLVSTGISAFGVNTPIFYLAYHAEEEGMGETAQLLQTYMGVAWAVGCAAFGLLARHNSAECRVARQYLTQAAAFVCAVATAALAALDASYSGYVLFAWIYGIFCGGYHYSLKMYTYERVRSRNFARAWGYVQCSQAVPIAIGVPLTGYISVGCGGKAGYYFSSTCSLIGSLSLFCIDLHKRNVAHKHTKENGETTGRNSICHSRRSHERGSATTPALGGDVGTRSGRELLELGAGSLGSPPGTAPPELTCISEEGGLDLDLPDHLLDDLDCGDCITSCNKVENYLVLSEYENNLIAELPNMNERRNRRWSYVVGNCSPPPPIPEQTTPPERNPAPWKKRCHNPNNRLITVINEAST